MTTKVWMTSDLLDYRQWMKQELRDVIQQNYIAGIETAELLEQPVFGEVDLLPAPQIPAIFLDGYQGKGDDYVAIDVSSDFPIASAYITIRDEHGNLIESCQAGPHPSAAEFWDMPANVRVPSGTRVTVRAVVMDYMGGFAVAQHSCTIP
jgi:hypothetical protein